MINRAHLFVTRKQLNRMTYGTEPPTYIVRHVCDAHLRFTARHDPSPFARNIRTSYTCRPCICDSPSRCAFATARRDKGTLAEPVTITKGEREVYQSKRKKRTETERSCGHASGNFVAGNSVELRRIWERGSRNAIFASPRFYLPRAAVGTAISHVGK